jgi:hypothetical protein
LIEKRIAHIDWRPGNIYEPTQYYNEPRLPWCISLIWNFIYVRRCSDAAPKWWYKASNFGLLSYMNESSRLSVEDALGRPVGMSFVAHNNTSAIGCPWLEGESKLDASARSGDPYRKTSRTTIQTLEFTSKVIDALSPGSGLDCIVSHGLDGFACSLPRIRQFILDLASPVAFMIILQDDKGLENHGVGISRWQTIGR